MVCGGKCNDFLGKEGWGILGKDVEKWGGKWYDVTMGVVLVKRLGNGEFLGHGKKLLFGRRLGKLRVWRV